MKTLTSTLAAALVLGALSVPAQAMSADTDQLRGSIVRVSTAYGISAAEIGGLDRRDLVRLKGIVSGDESEGKKRFRARAFVATAN